VRGGGARGSLCGLRMLGLAVVRSHAGAPGARASQRWRRESAALQAPPSASRIPNAVTTGERRPCRAARSAVEEEMSGRQAKDARGSAHR